MSTYRDTLRDRGTLEQNLHTDDGAGGQDSAWTVVRTGIRCRRVNMASTMDATPYERETYQDVFRIYCEDCMVRTHGKSSMYDLLRDETEKQFRFVYPGGVTYSIEGVSRPASGLHDHVKQIMWMDCKETRGAVGYMDLATA